MKKDEFRNFIRELIFEVKKEKSNDSSDGQTSKYKKNVDSSFDDTSSKLAQEIDKIVKKIDKNASCQLDDHNDVTAILPGVFKIRISPKGASLFDVEAFRNMSDRVYAISLTKDQIVDFVKVNFSVAKTSYVQSAYDKSLNNLKDNSTKKSKDLPKGEPVKHKEISDKDIEKNDDNKTDDPDSPMTTVEEKNIERQEDHGVEKNKQMPKIQKMIKKDVDNDLTKSWKK